MKMMVGMMMVAFAQYTDITSLFNDTAVLSTLLTAINAGGLSDTLAGDGPFTVFAPNNDAFASVSANVLAALLNASNKEKLVTLLTHHVAIGSVASGALSDGQMVETLANTTVKVGITGEAVTINGASVVDADVMASNGIVHVIDKVLVPTSLDGWIDDLTVHADDATNDMSDGKKAGIAIFFAGILACIGFIVFGVYTSAPSYTPEKNNQPIPHISTEFALEK